MTRIYLNLPGRMKHDTSIISWVLWMPDVNIHTLIDNLVNLGFIQLDHNNRAYAATHKPNYPDKLVFKS